MYWRIRKFTPDFLVKNLGVYAALIVSVLFNLALFSRINASQAAGVAKTDYAAFVKQVTRHLLDANYLTVRESMTALPHEMPYAIGKLKQNDFVPKDEMSLEATVRELTESQSVSNVKFVNIDVQKMVQRPGVDGKPIAVLPAEVSVQVAVHDNEGVRVTPLRMRYYLANANNSKTGQSYPVVLDYEELPQQNQAQ